MIGDNGKIKFVSDYMEGAYPEIIKKLAETNLYKTEGYGTDYYTKSAKEKIKNACQCPEGEVFFLVGGTQTNATVIDALLRQYQGVISADTGHISTHEAGAIEFGGHKVLTLPQINGKIEATKLELYMKDFLADDNHAHMVQPGMVYISNPTECGSIYSLQELTELSEVCRKYKLPLYMDGARLAYALASKENDVTLSDIARLCDVFYIGGTKCGALFGEAVVIPKKDYIPHFFTIIKQHGALLAKGRILGIQFDVLFTDGLYEQIGRTAIEYAEEIKVWCKENQYPLAFQSPTNQVFAILKNDVKKKLEEIIEFSFWEKYDENHTVVRFATSWATTKEDIESLKQVSIN